MWRWVPGGTWTSRLLALALLLTQVRVDAANPKKKSEPAPPKVEETVGDLAYVLQGGEIKVEGVGLVTGLDNTGADPPPSWHRAQLVDEMSKAGVEHASKLLGDSRFSMVFVRMTVTAGADPQDRIDVEVEVPSNCGTRSLAGGYLMPTRLREMLVAGGMPRTGSDMAIAQGPVMIGNAKDPKDAKVGRVLGGGHVKKESPFMLVIKEKRKSIRTAAILEKVISERFHQSEAGRQKGVATAKTDGFLVLRVPPSYHQNQERFFRVVQLLPMVDTPALRAARVAVWSKELHDPKTSGVAALKLEGLGTSALDSLQEGLKSPHPQVRYFAAESLAYLNEPAGSEVLAQTAIAMPQFRAYALAALASMDQPAAHVKLRKLMDETDIEVRYGAFNALRTLDPQDPSLGRVRVLDDPRGEEEQADEASDSMAITLSSASRRPRADDPFAFYVVDSEGPPVVHVSRTRRSEVVVFGQTQKLLPPIVLGTGAILLNAADKDDKVEISKIVPSKFGDSDVKLRTSLDLAEVIRQIANLGATYPDLVAILEAANRQRNLPGTLVVDAVPSSNVDYLQAAILGKDTTSTVDPGVRQASAQPTSPLRRLLGRWNRDTAEITAASSVPAELPPDTINGASSTGQDGKGSAAAKAATSDSSPRATGPSGTQATIPNSGTNAPSQTTPKKDDGVERTSGSHSDDPPRSRILDWLRRKFE
ncbi:MAG TPA: flagellar basal body P-ring protein FlgI [Isosphaeraceae bacterium]|nr:flagellar basal body P-ring protein FlgI [Isosphaeraceae bacterium]